MRYIAFLLIKTSKAPSALGKIIDLQMTTEWEFAFLNTAIKIFCLLYSLNIPHSNQIHQIILLNALYPSLQSPVDTGRKLNVHKTFRRRPGRLLNVLCTINLRPVPSGSLSFGEISFCVILPLSRETVILTT